MSQIVLPTTVPCPGCGEPADQVWCDASSFGAVEPSVVRGELTCHNESCAYRVRRQAELDYIAATPHVWGSPDRDSFWWVGRVLIAITVALWVAAAVLWSRG